MQSSSYYDQNVKTSSASIFHSVQNSPEFVTHQPMKIGNSVFNFRQQAMIQSYPRQILVTPQTQIQYPFQSGSYSEYKVPQFQGLIDEFYLSLEIKNEHATEDLHLPSNLCYLINKISVNKGVTDIQSINTDMIKFHNIFDITRDNIDTKYELLGINEDKSENVIAPGETKKLYIRIPNCFSRTYAFRKKITADELILKIYFRAGIISSGNVQNTDVKVTRQDLYLQYVEVPDKQTLQFSKIGLLDYMSHELVHQQYPLSNPVANQTYTIDLKSYNQDCAGMLVFLGNQNPQTKDLETMYSIDSLEFLDSQNNSQINNIKIDQLINKQNMIDIFKTNKWLHKNMDNLFIIPFVLDLEKTIQQGSISGAGFKHQGQDYKLSIKLPNTHNKELFVNVVYVSYSFLRINGDTWSLLKAE